MNNKKVRSFYIKDLLKKSDSRGSNEDNSPAPNDPCEGPSTNTTKGNQQDDQPKFKKFKKSRTVLSGKQLA